MTDTNNRVDGDVPVHPESGPVMGLPTLPVEFWDAREQFAFIRKVAHAHLVSADLVLHVALARIAAMSSHELFFNSGRKGSLNYFVAGIGASGVGKTTGHETANELIELPDYLIETDASMPERFADGLPIGSGEGIAEAFMGLKEVEVGTTRKGDPIVKNVRRQVRNNAFIVADEGEVFTKIGERKGATVGSTLRSAWSGIEIGQTNGGVETTRRIPRWSYSLGLVAGFQPSTALPLLADTSTGMAQRFALVSAIDPSIPDAPAAVLGKITLPALTMPAGKGSLAARSGIMAFPPSVIDQLRKDHLAKVRGERVVAECDSQGPLMRAKQAALLALLDNRHDKVTEDDWQFAGMLWATSCAVRDTVIAAAAEERSRQAEFVAQARVQLAERQAAAVASVPAKVDRLAGLLAAHVVNDGGLLRAAARKTMRSADRHLYEQVAERAAELGMLRVTELGALLPPEVPEPTS